MKSFEIFYTEEQAKDFIKELTWDGANPEMVETEEYDDDNGTSEKCFVVYYIPPKMR